MRIWLQILGSNPAALILSDCIDFSTWQKTWDPLAGNCATRRLAARLVPRFIHRFPQLVDEAASALLALHQGKWPSQYDDQALLKATQEDAFQGLGDVLHAAMRLVDKAVPTVLRIVEYLFR